MPRVTRPAVLLLSFSLLASCSSETPAPAADAATAGASVAAAAAPAGLDWSPCRLPGAAGPVAGKLFVVDGGQPDPEAEPGRETIRRVDILVPGPVSLLLTAPDASVWLLRPSPYTQIKGVFASGPQPQRVTGQALGKVPVATASQALGQDCGRYWLAAGPGPELAVAVQEVFGRTHDAVHGMRAGRVVIGEGGAPAEAPAPADATVAAPAGDPTLAREQLMAALREGVVRNATRDDLERWKQRHAMIGGLALTEAQDQALREYPGAYLVLDEFTVPAGLDGPDAALFLVEKGVPAPENLSARSLVLDLVDGSCRGAACPGVVGR